MRAKLAALFFGAWASAAATARAEGVSIERATVPWSDLVALLSRDGHTPARPRPGAPLAFALSRYDVEGEVDAGGQARLQIQIELQVLSEGWIVAPLLPGRFAVAEAKSSGEDGHRSMIAHDGKDVVFVVEGPGTFHVQLSAEGPLERTARGQLLVLEPPGLVGGRARLILPEDKSVDGRSRWKLTRSGKSTRWEAPIGPHGLTLLVLDKLARAEAVAAPAGLEDLSAVTVVSLGGRGVTRLLVTATPDAAQLFTIGLPPGATPWKVYVDKKPVPISALRDERLLVVPLEHTARVELAYTFDAPELGIRGQYRVELPRLPFTVRGARWQLWLPEGLDYRGTQASLVADGGCTASANDGARTTLDTRGECHAFSRPVLEPRLQAYVEGSYDQRLR